MCINNMKVLKLLQSAVHCSWHPVMFCARTHHELLGFCSVNRSLAVFALLPLLLWGGVEMSFRTWVRTKSRCGSGTQPKNQCNCSENTAQYTGSAEHDGAVSSNFHWTVWLKFVRTFTQLWWCNGMFEWNVICGLGEGEMVKVTRTLLQGEIWVLSVY